MCLVNSPQSGNNSLQHTDPLNSPQNNMTSSRFFPFTKTSQSHKYRPISGNVYKVQNNQESPKNSVTHCSSDLQFKGHQVKWLDAQPTSFQANKSWNGSQPFGLLCYLKDTQGTDGVSVIVVIFFVSALWTCPLIFTTLTAICVVWDHFNLGWPNYDLKNMKYVHISAVTLTDLCIPNWMTLQIRKAVLLPLQNDLPVLSY